MAEDSRRLRTAGLSRLTHQQMVCCLAFILLYALVANVPFALASRAGDFVPWGDELPCSAVGRVSADPSVCSWAQIIARVHRSMATVAMQNHPRQTIFVLVGDHAPPFGEPALRSLFAPGVVPYVVLIPRQSHPQLLTTVNLTMPFELIGSASASLRHSLHLVNPNPSALSCPR